ncbi:hypothetical protein DL768_006127 [Monosporascus sp. mg162]|nr:hypothetical protein DL768_006127 [Monosporascus sp. mg162]
MAGGPAQREIPKKATDRNEPAMRDPNHIQATEGIAEDGFRHGNCAAGRPSGQYSGGVAPGDAADGLQHRVLGLRHRLLRLPAWL